MFKFIFKLIQNSLINKIFESNLNSSIIFSFNWA